MNESLKRDVSGHPAAGRVLDLLFGRTGSHWIWVLSFYSFIYVLFFLPVALFGGLLAPGDGLLYHVAYFYSNKLQWDPLLGSGFPMTADPQVIAWYPPALFLSFIPGSWNVFVISAYVMASCFTYGYIYTLTRSKAAALGSGMIYGMCGFMMAHLGHTTIIHAAVWLPLTIWSVEMLRQKIDREWIAIGSLAVACCVLAGHLQIVSYSLLFSSAYAVILGWNAAAGRRRFYLVCLLLMLLGLGLASIQIFPAVELASFSNRTNFSFTDFVSYSLPYSHLLLFLFPAAFGGLPAYGTTPYFGAWNLTEMSNYVGLLTLMLAAIGFSARRRNPIAVFWLCAGIVALLLALGDGTPLSRLIYQLPVLGKFRASARNVIELAFAFSVLAGFGIDAIRRQQVTRRVVLITAAAGTFLMAVGSLLFRSAVVLQYAQSHGTANLDVRPWTNPALAVPLIMFVGGAIALLFWHKQPKSVFRQSLLLIVLGLDLASFGWLYEWQNSPGKEVLVQPAIVNEYKPSLDAGRQRMVSVRGTLGGVDELPPNLSRLWDMPNATGYGPLTLSTVTDLLSLLPDGSLAPRWKEQADQGLNLAAVRYVFLPPRETLTERDVDWEKENMNIWLGTGCDRQPRNSVKFQIPKPVRTTEIALVTRLACSTGLADGQDVVHLIATDSSGISQTVVMKAGQHTSEWALDCPNVKPGMQHSRAQVFSSFAAKMYDTPCEGHFYYSRFSLNQPAEITELEFQWVGQTGAMSIEKVSLSSEGGSSWTSLNALSAADSNFRLLSDLSAVRVYENVDAMPRAWLAPEAVLLKPDEILRAIKTSVLPDGTAFDPAQTVLVEQQVSAIPTKPDPTGYAYVGSLSGTVMEVRTSSASDAFLVTSDTWYPGWQATVDGTQASIFRANYTLRGVRVPAGRHLVRFEYRPRMFYVGAAISVVSLLALGGILAAPFVGTKKTGPKVDTIRTPL